ncbi:hypothetical protein SEMRO_2686_G334580.1 [Seminavis robusta]|uniref:Uncharacterized protein n=1 Tax=Seminavis robusta TaxID=568900 RepID=A0A9N8I0G4_9STRA|nr:hypothetical protein SEMRO_2686_G334580.1 [Seminavis robusta]|eukprot:Sro2686_g334580.1 n/a (146) ;mRNA; r:6239-6676
MESFDMVRALWALLPSSNITFTVEHIDGHMDGISGHALTFMEQLNVRMDTLSKTYRKTIAHHNPTGPPPTHLCFENEGWSPWQGPLKLSSPNKHALLEAISTPVILKYWTTARHNSPARFPPEATQHIHWKMSNGRLMKALPAGM